MLSLSLLKKFQTVRLAKCSNSKVGLQQEQARAKGCGATRAGRLAALLHPVLLGSGAHQLTCSSPTPSLSELKALSLQQHA